MSQQREPLRWADPSSESDPTLRRLLQNARMELGDRGLATRIEQAVHTSAAADSSSAARAFKATARAWRPWIGVATLLLTLTGTMIATQLRIPAATSGATPSAAIGVSTNTTRNNEPLAADADPVERPQPLQPTRAADSSDGNAADGASPKLPAKRARSSKGHATLGLAANSGDPRSAKAPATLGPDLAANSGARSSASVPTAAGPNAATMTTTASSTRPSTETTTSSASDAPAARAPDLRAIAPELSLISAAQRALRTAPGEALALSEKHANAYPNGRFSQEREEIAISALWALGHRAAARTRAQTFLNQHPRALSAPRITRLLDAAR